MLKTLSFLLLLLPLWLQAQPSDTLWVNQAIANASEVYNQHIKGESLLYSGTDFKKYIPIGDEFPYFLSDDWIEGTLVYDDQRYNKIWLYYDLSTDQVLVENYNFANTIQLVKERVREFTLENHRFLNLMYLSNEPGFYEVLYEGKTKVYARHSKSFQSEIRFGELINKFIEKTSYFIQKENEFIPVTNKASVLRIFSDRKKEVNQNFRKYNLSFSDNKAQSLALMAEIYDQLNP